MMTFLAQRLLLVSIAAITATVAIADDTKDVTDKPTKKRGPGFTVSKATTRITKPLTKNGYVDYVAAINQQFSRGVTPDINAAVPLWKAIGTAPIEDWKEEHRKRLFGALGVKEPKTGTGKYVSVEGFAGKVEDKSAKREEVKEGIWHAMEAAKETPWSEDVYPKLAAWLAANEDATAFVVAASRCPRYYNPLVAMEGDFAMIATPLPMLDEFRRLADLLIFRAMQATAAGKYEAAWSDLLSCWRLGRLAGQGATLIDSVIGIAIEQMAAKATVSLVHHAKLSGKQIAAMREDLRALPKRAKAIDKIDVAERYMFLDTVQTLERKGISSIKELLEVIGFVNSLSGMLGLSDSKEAKTGFSRIVKRVWFRMLMDWELMMRDGNQWYDRLVDVGREPTQKKRAKKVAEFHEELLQLRLRAIDPKSVALEFWFGKTPRRIVSERVSGVLLSLLLPAMQSVLGAEHRADMNVEMVDTAFALKLYQNKHGKYPAKLDAIVPEYLKAVPLDMHADKAPIRYKKIAAGFLLYSVGRDQKDQGGPGLGSDDVGFRVSAAMSPK